MRKIILLVISTIVGIVIGSIAILQLLKNTDQTDKVNKFKGYYNMLNEWLILKHADKSFDDYLLKCGYKQVAIYGMGEMGKRLYDELKNTEIEIKYAIDNNAKNIYSEVNVFDINDTLEEVDAIIVSCTFAFSEIEEKLRKITSCPIISLEDVVYEM